MQRHEIVRWAGVGCLPSALGFALSAIVLIPLWWIYPFSTFDSSAMLPTLFSFLVGVGYSILMAGVAVVGLPRRWSTALLLTSAGAVFGFFLGSFMRDAMLEGCLQGTGPQPDYCHHEDPPELRPVVPAYVVASMLLGLALWLAGALRRGVRSVNQPS